MASANFFPPMSNLAPVPQRWYRCHHACTGAVNSASYAIFGLNLPFRQKIAYFDVFGPFPKMFDLGCYIPLESVIFFWFFEMKKNRKSQKRIIFFRLLYLIEIAGATPKCDFFSKNFFHPILYWPIRWENLFAGVPAWKSWFLNNPNDEDNEEDKDDKDDEDEEDFFCKNA